MCQLTLSSSLSLSIPLSYTLTYTRTHTYTHLHTHVHTHTCTHAHMHTCTQLIIGDEVALTFGCASFMEREEWTKAFNIFKKMAPPIGGQNTPTMNGKPHLLLW